MERRLATERDRSREPGLFTSGDWSRDTDGVDACRKGLALSTTDGDLEGSLLLRTEKKLDCGLSLPMRVGVGAGESPDGTDSISSALIRCEMLDPTVPLRTRLPFVCCCVTLCR
jgi:hypothetical protein